MYRAGASAPATIFSKGSYVSRLTQCLKANTMHTLSTLLRKLAIVTQHIAAMQNEQVAFYLASQLKSASAFSSVDYVDIADTVADYLSEATADDFCPEDIKRLHSIGITLRQCLPLLHTVQDSLIQNPAA